MTDRAACERRVYRLATLLTGKPVAAAKVIQRVVDTQPDLRRLDNAHLDRLTVLRSREVTPGAIVDERVAPETASRMAGLATQQREAWVFARVYRLTPRETAKAMDCSVTAIKRHIEQADLAMGSSEEDPAGGVVEAVRGYALSLDVPPFYRAAQQRRRRLRLVRRVVIAVIVIVVVLVAVDRVLDAWVPRG